MPGSPDGDAARLLVVRDLVARSAEGDLEAFNQLVVVYQDYLFALVVRVVGNREAAADAVQEAFFSAYRNLDRFRGDSFRSWLSRIALNAATEAATKARTSSMSVAGRSAIRHRTSWRR